MRVLMIGMAALLAAGLAEDLPLVQPAELAAQLASKNPRPVIFQVGPNVLYRGKHIVGAIYAGPAAKPAGLDLLKEAAGKLPRDREIVLYCGCCPWSNCPNVKPAIALLRQMGFTHVKAMFIEANFSKDWTEKGYPVEAGAAKN